MTTFDAVILGVVEGITEYLPISSTGHLILVSKWLGHDGAASAAFDIVIQLGAILAVLVHYRALLWERLTGLFARDAKAMQLFSALVLGFLPAAVAGLLLRKTIKAHLFGPLPVAVALVVGGIVMIVVARRATGGESSIDAVDRKRALWIGLGQCASLWPGMSRSMSTIVAGQLVGLSTAAAAEFSFLLGLPTLGAATLYEAYKSRAELMTDGGMTAVAIGLVVSFFVAWIVIAAFIRYLQRRGLTAFGVYRVVLGAAIIVLTL